MAAFELNIKATSLTDLEQAIKDLHARFPGLEATGPSSAQTLAEAAAQAGEAGARRRGRPPRVATPAHPPAAGEAQAVSAEDAAGSDLGAAAGGDAGALGSEAAAEAEGAVQGGPAEDQDGGVLPPVSEGLEAAEAGGVPEGAGVPTLDQLKDATKALIAAKGVAVAQQVYGKLGIAKPGQTPDEKIPAAMAAVNRVTEVGLDAWLKEQA